MEDRAQARAYGEADFSAGDGALLERLAQLFDGNLGDALIDLGCGPGNISFRLAERYPHSHVWGIDGAAEMLQIARERLASAPGRWPRLHFAQALLTAQGVQPAITQAFTAVLSNSLLHHLHEPQALWMAVREMGAAGAAVYVKDLRRPPSPEAARALRDRHLGEAPAVLRHDYLCSLHAAFTAAEVMSQLEQAGLATALQVAEVDDRYLEVWGRLP